MTREKAVKLYYKERALKILKCRESFWEFQKLMDPKSFNDSRHYLTILALTLQSFYESSPCSYTTKEPIEEYQKLDMSDGNVDITFEETEEDGTTITVDCSKTDILIIEIPPRHHKSHSLINFEDWVFGKDPKQILITSSYNSVLANEFSQYVRDGIEQERMTGTDIIYADIFPKTKTKHGDRSKQRWSLEGSFLSYTGAGIMTGVTGKGGNFIVFDDPVKGALEAFNEAHLDKLWNSYANTWLSRLEKPRKQILVMTPWIEGDPGDRIIKGAEESGEVVTILNFKAHSENQGMLCDDILDQRSFDILSSRLDPIILSGNYLCKRQGLVGKMYPNFRTYTPDELPTKFEEIYCYTDTADEGSDYLASGIIGIISRVDEYGMKYREGYMLDVYFTTDGMEITEPRTAKFLTKNHIQSSMTVMIESNNGGRGFSRNVKKILQSEYKEKAKGIRINWFHQSENKDARINSESNTVMKYIIMPHDWDKRWPEYSKQMKKYSREGKNPFDDCADMTTGLAEKINNTVSISQAMKQRDQR